jgi:hypothetical protein
MSSDALSAWAPSLRVFLRRTVIVGVLTLMVVAVAGWAIGVTTGYWQALYVGPVLALAYNMAFEDPARWRLARENRWHLRTDALIHLGPDGESRIPLADIIDVRQHLGWTVIIFLKGGLRVRITYVDDPASIVSQILAARARLTS